MEKTAYVTNLELRTAWQNWLYFHKGLHCEEVEIRFFNYCHTVKQSFIDDSLDWDNDGDRYHVAVDTAQRIKQLAGSYSETICKAYYIKNPWKITS